MTADRESGENSLAGRIRRCADLAGSGDALSQKTAIPRRTLEDYLTGKSEPKAARLVAIARACGVSLDWLAAGEGPMRREAVYTTPAPNSGGVQKADPLLFKQFVNHDEDLLTAVVVAVEELFAEEGLNPSPRKKGQFVAALYELALADEDRSGAVDKKKMAPLLRLVK